MTELSISNEPSSSIKNSSSTLLKTTIQQVRTKQITKWFISEEHKDENDEILCRLIVWDDSIPIDYSSGYLTVDSSDYDEEDNPASYEAGYVNFTIYDKNLYDRICKYFNASDPTPSSFVECLDERIEFKVIEKKTYSTIWSSSQGSIRNYHRWFSHKRLKDPGTEGRITFVIENNKKLFDDFVAYTLNFNP